MKALLFAVVAAVVLVCFTILAAIAAYTFNNAIEARRDLVRKQQSDRMIETIEDIGSKIPDFKLFKRDDKGTGSDSRVVRRFSR